MDLDFSHVGIPTLNDKNWDGYYEPGKIRYTDFSKDEFAIEWVSLMRTVRCRR